MTTGRTAEDRPGRVAKMTYSLAVVVAVGLMVASGAGYRALARYLGNQETGTVLPKGTLARLPMKIGDWEGREVALSEGVIRATDTDDHINRHYVKTGTGEGVGLFLAYGVRARDLMPHRPQVCYPGNGWVLKGEDMVSVDMPDGTKLEYRVIDFSRGGLESNRISVVNYYVVDGRSCPDVSLLRSRAWRGSGAIDYMVQIQIASPGEGWNPTDTGRRAAQAFAKRSAPTIRALLDKAFREQAVQHQSAAEKG